MIPPDLATRLRNVSPDLPAQSQATTPVRQINEILAQFKPGDRILAEIQALLPNGTYRAIVSQREMTLALPFAAKAGDSLELEVQESNGRLSLALVNTHAASNSETPDPVPTSLSRTGSLIGQLMSEVDQAGGKAKPLMLQSAQALMPSPPDKASEMAALLKTAITQSGMFYEAHQALWAEGKIPTSQLLSEPQGQLSQPAAFKFATQESLQIAARALLAQNESPPPQTAPATNASQASEHLSAAPEHNELLPENSGSQLPLSQNSTVNTRHEADSSSDNLSQLINKEPNSPLGKNTPAPETPMNQRSTIHPELTPLVQQQLNALATQHFVWHGQVWPEQNMEWEISREQGNAKEQDQYKWKTRLHLDLPSLGGVTALVSLGPAGTLDLAFRLEEEGSQNRLNEGKVELQSALAHSGLQLVHFGITLDSSPPKTSD